MILFTESHELSVCFDGIVGNVKEFRIIDNLNDYVELHSFSKMFLF